MLFCLIYHLLLLLLLYKEEKYVFISYMGGIQWEYDT